MGGIPNLVPVQSLTSATAIGTPTAFESHRFVLVDWRDLVRNIFQVVHHSLRMSRSLVQLVS